MTQQRGHPHHHRAAERRPRGRGPQLPEHPPFQPWAPFGYGPRPRIYPKGWISRPWWRSRSLTVRVFCGLWALALLIALVIALLSRL